MIFLNCLKNLTHPILPPGYTCHPIVRQSFRNFGKSLKDDEQNGLTNFWSRITISNQQRKSMQKKMIEKTSSSVGHWRSPWTIIILMTFLVLKTATLYTTTMSEVVKMLVLSTRLVQIQ